MGEMAHWFFNFITDSVFISGNVPTTAVAIAILCSLWISVACFLWSLCARYGGWRNSGTERRRAVSVSHNSISTFGIRLRGGFFHKRRYLMRQPPQPEFYNNNNNSNRSPVCVVCTALPCHPACLYIRCETCCKVSKISICMDVGIFRCQQAHEGPSLDGPTEVDFSFLKLSACPNRMGYIGSQLSCLNLSNNCLISLPEEIGLLRGLEFLYLQYNCLTELPDSIGNLTRLIDLSVKNNRLEKLPDSLGKLHKLQYLNITNNLIESLPSILGNLTDLIEVSAYANELSELPMEICNLVNLEALYVGQNLLEKLPEKIGNLVRLWELDVSECQLTRLPDGITRCANLERLWLSKNKLRCLPDQMGQLHSLKELSIRENQVQYFPASMEYLQLYNFSVSQNPLVEERDKVSIASLSVCCPYSIPSLVELCARRIVRENIRWYPDELPKELQNMLKLKKHCSRCRGVFLNFFKSSIVFGTVGFLRVPLYQQICTPHSDKCRP